MNGYGFFLLCRVCRPYGHIFPQFEPALSIDVYKRQVSGEYNNYCGLYGYTTFNAVRYFEHINVKDSRDPKNDARCV